MIRIAVATGMYWRKSETQISNHVANLSGGRAVVVAKRRGLPDPFDKPHLIVKDAERQLPITSRIAAAIPAGWNYRRNGNLRVPYGARRQVIIDFLKEHGVGAILCEFATEAVRTAPVGRDAGIPVFTMLRGVDASAFLRRPNQVEALRRTVPMLTGVFSVSQFLLDNLAAHGITHPNSYVFPSGVDTETFRPAEKVPGSVLAVGRFIEKKRPDITIRAFARAAKDLPHARLQMIGEGEMLDDCRSLAETLGIADRVEFAGSRDHSYVRESLARSQICVQHSVTGANGDTEGLPTSIQEAMSAGMAILSTRHAGIPEAVTEGETGYLVDEGDEDAFARQLGLLLTGERDLAAMGERARAVACERFDKATLMSRLEAKINELA